MQSVETVGRIRDALACLPADDRALWVRIGMAVKSALGDEGFELWDAWSRTSDRYREQDARTVWRSIEPDGGITLGTLFHEVAQYGKGRERPASAGKISRDSEPPGEGDVVPLDPHCNSATVRTYAAWKKLPEAFLRSLDLTDMRYQREPALRIPYRNAQGAEVAVRIRSFLEKESSGDRRFVWRRGDKPVLYGLERLGTPEHVVLVEGESDCHTLWYHGIPALGLPGAGAWTEARDAPHFAGINTIYVVVEPDQGGEGLQRWLARSAIQDRAYLVSLSPFKDPSALHCDDSQAFRERWAAAIGGATRFSEMAERAKARESEQAWQVCQALARHPRILEAFAEAYRAAGAVGEVRTATILYLALTSRFLARPVSVAVKGPSSGGKSFTVATVLRFFPPEAYYCMTAISDRALAYTEADLEHRFLVVYEAAGIVGDFASYLVRSLLSEGRLIYEVVEKTANGFRPRRIEKQGPTGLLVTTTAVKLHPENETRLLSLQVTDTREQTRAVLQAIAVETPKAIDLEPWLALQQWLTHVEHHVVIPYASALAESIPPVAVRLRRDFGQLLGLIRAHAILHQATRDRDAAGQIVATLEDYDVVRSLVVEVIAEGIHLAVPPTVRETVHAVGDLVGQDQREASLREIAEALRLDKSAAARRVAAAVHLGHLRNLEERKGRPARIVLGDVMPNSPDVLPAPELLQCGSVDGGDDVPPRDGAA